MLVTVSLTAISASAATSPAIDPAFQSIRELAASAIEASTASEEARLLVVAATPPPVESLNGIPLRGDLTPQVVSPNGIPLRGDFTPARDGFSSSGIPLRGDISENTASVAEPVVSLVAAEAPTSEAAFVASPTSTVPTALPFLEFELTAEGIPLRGDTALGSGVTLDGIPLRGDLTDASTNAPLTGLALLEARYQATRDSERLSLSKLANAVGAVTGAGFSTPDVVTSWMEAALPRRIAVFTALEYFGAPYVAAAAGPDSFDCSGLTLTAWSAAGVDLEHWSVLQQASVSPVPYELTIPGDLAFYEGGPTAGGVWNTGHVTMVFAPGFLVQSSPSHGVWVDAFANHREATSFGSPAVAATI